MLASVANNVLKLLQTLLYDSQDLIYLTVLGACLIISGQVRSGHLYMWGVATSDLYACIQVTDHEPHCQPVTCDTARRQPTISAQ